MILKELLALNESTDVQATLIAAISAALVRHASVRSIDVDEEEIFFSVGYEFPEHRDGLVAVVRKAAKSIGKVTAQKGGERGDYGVDYAIELKTPIETAEAKSLETAIKKHFKV